MEEPVKHTVKEKLIVKKSKKAPKQSTHSYQLAKNREKVKTCRKKQGISSISSRLVVKIPEPGFSVNKYETKIILSFD